MQFHVEPRFRSYSALQGLGIKRLFQKLRVPVSGVRIIRAIVYWDLYSGAPQASSKKTNPEGPRTQIIGF